jgi:Flp pilus assembly protein TadD
VSKQPGRTLHRRGNRSRVCLFLAMFAAVSAFAECEQAAGRLESSEGSVSIEQAGNWQPLAMGACVPVGVRVQVSGGRAVFRLANETLLRASGNTLLQFSSPEKKSWIHLFDGVLHFITRTPHAFDVQTDYVNAGVKGTEFILAANRTEQYGQVVMLEGEVLASNESGQQSVRGGAAVIARKDEAPHLLTVPSIRDAVQWTLYYPPLPAVHASRFQPAVDRLYRSDAAGAIAYLETVPTADRDADYFALAAAIDLHRGEVGRAKAELDSALTLQPDHPAALALSAMTALATGDVEQASALLDRAQASRDAAVLIARSYQQQARFQLSAALTNAQQAAVSDPNDALIQARVAELALMTGDTQQAAIAANRAIGLQPNFARAHAIDGFVRLQQLKFDAAEVAFKRAAELDATDPLPRLGLGLINIRHNRVGEGREQLALSVALDPGQSLLRSYLGKAYQEEGRERLASDQYILAKIFDDADPTPWFYSALLARAQNRPFDALDDLNESITRNDNRAVYRSRLQLDADEAARTASQAEIYRELGFNALAQNTAARAVSAAPGEYGGHRQLAEAYADDPQYDAARASEVLQAQLLQPLSATPLMPLLGETNLLATEGAGPSALGFREYNAMFVREKPWLSISGLGGGNQTGADEIALSGIYDRVAYALNQYHYETSGYRDNNDARYDVLSAYGKFQATEDLSFLLRSSRREEVLGNLEESLFDAESASVIREPTTTNAVLLGSNFKLTPGIDMLAAVGYQKVDGAHHEYDSFSDLRIDSLKRASNAEVQWQFGDLAGHLITGANFGKIENDSVRRDIIFDSESPAELVAESTDRYKAGYAYWTISPLSQLELTAGLTYAELDTERLGDRRSGWYPKFSVYYQPDDIFDFRAAWFQSMKRPFSIDQTIEPTQIGGFNQFNDETDGIESENYALGFDLKAGGGHRFGVEGLFKNSYIPYDLSGAGSPKVEDKQAQVFWNWAINPWAVSLEYRYENGEYVNPPPVFRFASLPIRLTTQSVPLKVKWLHQSGFTVATTATYFHQKMNSFQEDAVTTNFTLLNVIASYTFLQRQAEVELRCSNLLDKGFRYQSTNLLDSTPRISPFIPERTYELGLKFVY